MKYVYIFLIIFILLIALFIIDKKYGSPKFKEYTRQDIEAQISHYGLNTVVDRLCLTVIYPHPRTFITKAILLEEYRRLRAGMEGDYEILVDYFEPDVAEKIRYFEQNKRKLVERCVTRYSKLFPEILAELIDENFPEKNGKTVWEYYQEIKKKINGRPCHIISEPPAAGCMIAAGALDCSYDGFEPIAEMFHIRKKFDGSESIKIE